MPTVLRLGPYRFFFFAGDGEEPPHVHVERDDKVAEFWLDPVRLQRAGGFPRAELRTVHEQIDSRRADLLESWHDFFGDSD
jgi:hypothetical protein